MNGYLSSLYKRNLYLVLLATLTLPSMSNAETYDFKVVYAEVPGINEILVGDTNAAIEILEARSKDPDRYYIPDELATLCASEGVEATVSKISEIATATVEQATNATQVGEAVQGIAEVTEQAAAGSEEMASSSEELGAQAAGLRDLVGRFKISPETTTV